jgi:lipoprotein signal peptidase
VLNVRTNLKNKYLLEIFVVLGIYIGLRLFHEWMSQVFEVFKNKGISFGVELGIWGWLIGIILGIFLVVKWGKYWGAKLMILGAMGNLADRLRWGGVRDYWNLLDVWINNIYDWVIVLGGILLIIELWRKSSK